MSLGDEETDKITCRDPTLMCFLEMTACKRITVHSRKTRGVLKYLQQYVDKGTGFDVKQLSPERD